MAKVKTAYVCQDCGTSHSKWQGQCQGCSAWNSLVEEIVDPSTPSQYALSSSAIKLSNSKTSQIRVKTQIPEVDRVLGGGLVSGSYTLLGGDPGIGKSTLLLQVAQGLAEQNLSLLYVSAEESVQQTSLRAERLQIQNPNIEVWSENQLEKIIEKIKKTKPDVLVLDSIQTVYLSELSSSPGTVAQVRECASRLMGLVKSLNMSTFLIGHITKEGSLAGPKVLEHIVDTVISFEGDQHNYFRLLRALKNRFGPTSELGLFEMTEKGLKEVKNPSQIFLNENRENLIGSTIYSAMEGTRPLLCEVQALTTATNFNMPRRVALGVDINRLHLLTAILDRNLSMNLYKNDIFVSIVGGFKALEPSMDLAICSILHSCQKNKSLSSSLCILGEVGLTGEVRPVTFIDQRMAEAQKLGLTKFLLPHSNAKKIKNKDLQVIGIKNIKELPAALEKFYQKPKVTQKVISSLEETASI